MRLPLRFPLGAFALSVALGADALSQQAVFRANVEVVSIPVAVLQGGQPVEGLSASDFVLTDDGVRQDIEVTGAMALPVDVTIIGVAVPFSEEAQLRRALLGAESVNSLLNPNDRLRLLSADDAVRELLPMKAVSRNFPRAPVGSSHGSSLHDAVFNALVWQSPPDRRHLVVVFTLGQDTWSTLDASRLVAAARRSDALVYAVLLSSKATPPVPPDVNRRWQESVRALTAVTDQTGGDVYSLDGAASVFERVLRVFRTTYLLQYTPRGVSKEGWHAVRVDVARPGHFDIRARKGYEGVSRSPDGPGAFNEPVDR